MEEIIRWDNLKRVLEEFGNELRNTYQDKLIRDDKIATGELLNSVEYKVDYDDRSITLSLELAEYWKWVEEGREPGGAYPPWDDPNEGILNWIKMKPVVPEERNGVLPTEKQLAFLIARKIAEEGIEPGYQLRDAKKDLMDDFEDKIDEAITLDVEQYLDVIFSSYFN